MTTPQGNPFGDPQMSSPFSSSGAAPFTTVEEGPSLFDVINSNSNSNQLGPQTLSPQSQTTSQSQQYVGQVNPPFDGNAAGQFQQQQPHAAAPSGVFDGNQAAYQTQPPPQGQPPMPASTYGNGYPTPAPYSAPSDQQQYQNALVPAQQPPSSYPYSTPAAAPATSQAIVTSTNQSSQWSLGGISAPPALGNTQSFDPFAPPPQPPPAPVPPPQPAPPPTQPAPPAAAPAPTQAQAQSYPPQAQAHTPQPVPAEQPKPPVQEVGIVPSSGYSAISDPDGHSSAPPPQYSSREAQSGRQTGRENELPTGDQTRNRYSGELAQNAPIGAAPLPKAEMVRKTGYVLSRISFRTIVMKKWKQSFWVQYGPHTMLWFRSQADFDDWLNNPYHNQAQRNFLIKLAVNFAHDLYKPNVRGYQVTQCRTKSYGAKLVRQFKLERWMDYGPTIAAAFGSYNPKEVDDLRDALVACMRNTPLNGGIRATGAVRDRSGHQPQPQVEGGESGSRYRSQPDDPSRSNSEHPISENRQADKEQSVAESVDLLGDINTWDDPTTSSLPPQVPAMTQQQQFQQNHFSAAPQPPQNYGGVSQAPYPGSGSVPSQQPAYHQGAIVPVTQSGMQAYPGAPPPPPNQQYVPQPAPQQYGQPQGQQYQNFNGMSANPSTNPNPHQQQVFSTPF